MAAAASQHLGMTAGMRLLGAIAPVGLIPTITMRLGIAGWKAANFGPPDMREALPKCSDAPCSICALTGSAWVKALRPTAVMNLWFESSARAECLPHLRHARCCSGSLEGADIGRVDGSDIAVV
jgi:hypothetical protein